MILQTVRGRVHYQVGNAKSSFSSTLEEEGVVGQLGVGGLQGSQNSGHGDGGGALDVVVEGAVLVAVLLKEPGSITGIGM